VALKIILAIRRCQKIENVHVQNDTNSDIGVMFIIISSILGMELEIEAGKRIIIAIIY
jgi:hypothetical protein